MVWGRVGTKEASDRSLLQMRHRLPWGMEPGLAAASGAPRNEGGVRAAALRCPGAAGPGLLVPRPSPEPLY